VYNLSAQLLWITFRVVSKFCRCRVARHRRALPADAHGASSPCSRCCSYASARISLSSDSDVVHGCLVGGGGWTSLDVSRSRSGSVDTPVRSLLSDSPHQLGRARFSGHVDFQHCLPPWILSQYDAATVIVLGLELSKKLSTDCNGKWCRAKSFVTTQEHGLNRS
jgi:hypothetical protein